MSLIKDPVNDTEQFLNFLYDKSMLFAEAIVKKYEIVGAISFYCAFCGQMEKNEIITHKNDCVVVVAKEFLELSKKKNQNYKATNSNQ